jgi:hypothetical protein
MSARLGSRYRLATSSDADLLRGRGGESHPVRPPIDTPSATARHLVTSPVFSSRRRGDWLFQRGDWSQ